MLEQQQFEQPMPEQEKMPEERVDGGNESAEDILKKQKEMEKVSEMNRLNKTMDDYFHNISKGMIENQRAGEDQEVQVGEGGINYELKEKQEKELVGMVASTDKEGLGGTSTVPESQNLPSEQLYGQWQNSQLLYNDELFSQVQGQDNKLGLANYASQCGYGPDRWSGLSLEQKSMISKNYFQGQPAYDPYTGKTAEKPITGSSVPENYKEYATGTPEQQTAVLQKIYTGEPVSVEEWSLLSQADRENLSRMGYTPQ